MTIVLSKKILFKNITPTIHIQILAHTKYIHIYLNPAMLHINSISYFILRNKFKIAIHTYIKNNILYIFFKPINFDCSILVNKQKLYYIHKLNSKHIYTYTRQKYIKYNNTTIVNTYMSSYYKFMQYMHYNNL